MGLSVHITVGASCIPPAGRLNLVRRQFSHSFSHILRRFYIIIGSSQWGTFLIHFRHFLYRLICLTRLQRLSVATAGRFSLEVRQSL